MRPQWSQMPNAKPWNCEPHRWLKVHGIRLLQLQVFSASRSSLALVSAVLAIATLICTPAGASNQWSDYEIIIWQDQTPERLAGLARLGVTAGKIFGTRGPLDLTKVPLQIAPFQQQGLRFYLENIATDFYAAYHRWHPDHPVTWLFDETKRAYQQDPGDPSTFVRAPSLSDPTWLNRIAQRLQQHVQAYAPYRPLFYSLADEAGIADLTAAWDFDFAPQSLAEMRVWLKAQYGTLDALNREWGTHFSDWAAVMPMTTDAALKQPDENFAAWADFKAWMDISFGRAVRAGTDAVHAADPRALAAIEGAQPPGWGGYDYSHLAGAADVIEMWNADNSVEIARSLVPRLITLTTSPLTDSSQVHGIWDALLLGGRGLMLWDDNNSFVGDNGAPTPRGEVLGALAAELRGGIAAQLIASTPDTDQVAILYSPESQCIQWLLDRKTDGKIWSKRESETEYLDKNTVRTAWQRAAGILTHLGVQPRWLSREMIEGGALRTDQIRLLLLPHAMALSPREAQQIRTFTASGGTVLVDSEPGLFDAHGRRLARPLLADLMGANGPIILMAEMQPTGEPTFSVPLLAQVQQILGKAGVVPRFALSTPTGALAADIEARVFRNGDATIIGLERDWTGADNDKSQDVVISFTKPVYVYDLRHPGVAQLATRFTYALDEIAPTLIVVVPSPMPTLTLAGPVEAHLGSVAEFAITPASIAPALERVVHLQISAPNGRIRPANTVNLAVHGGRAIWRLPLAPDDPVGSWTIRMVDVLSGQTTQHDLRVLGPSGGVGGH